MTDDELQEGSPPRMRGKAKCQLDNVRCGRITPAYAGKSGIVLLPLIGYEDHPRVCGEKQNRRTKTMKATGSPPRMRGKEVKSNHIVLPPRITPAYAGKRNSEGVTRNGI